MIHFGGNSSSDNFEGFAESLRDFVDSDVHCPLCLDDDVEWEMGTKWYRCNKCNYDFKKD